MKKKKQKNTTHIRDISKDCPIRCADLSGEPPVEVARLKHRLAVAVSQGQSIPFLAFVSGPGINVELGFPNYNPERDRRAVADRLMEMIRQGADRIVIVSEVWIPGEDMAVESDGVLIYESTPLNEIGHLAQFEERLRLGDWGPVPACKSANQTGNLENLFERAWKVPNEVRPVVSPRPQTGVGSQRKET